jgi:uncharacterized protein (TIGR02453 family)
MINKNTLTFLDELAKNNTKEWFDQNRKRYEGVKKDYYSAAEQLLNAMKTIDGNIEPLTRKECVFRINRDIRFSADKSPYKTNIGVYISGLGVKNQGAGYYLHIQPGASFVGGGIYMPDSPTLKRLRKEIQMFHREFEGIIESPDFQKCYKGLDRDPSIMLKKAPQGYDIDDPAIEYLKLKSYTAVKKISDKDLLSNDAETIVMDHFKALKPLVDFINNALVTDENGTVVGYGKY